MPQRLTDLDLDEVSLVDSPANKHARVMMFKRAKPTCYDDGNYPSGVHKREFSDAERKEDAKAGVAMPGGGYPIENEDDLRNAVRAIGRAKDPGKTKAHIRSRAKALGLESLLPETWSKRDSGTAVIALLAKRDAKAAEIAKGYGDGQSCTFDEAQAAMEDSEAARGLMDEVSEAVCALGSAVWSIQADDTISDKGGAVQESLNQFGEHVKTIVPEGVENALVAQALAEAGYAINPQGGIELSKRGDSMSLKAIAKRLGLDESASPEVILAAMAKADDEKAAKDKAEKEKADKIDAAVRKMSAKHRSFMGHPDAKMPSGGKSAFSEMSSDERDAHMSKNPIDDDEDDVGKSDDLVKKGLAFRDPDTNVILTKKDFGTEAGFQFAKSQAKKSVEQALEIQKGKDEVAKTARVAKAGTDLVLIGKADEVGGLLFDIGKHDAGLADKVHALLKTANDAMAKGNLFKEHGSSQAAAGSAADIIEKGAEEIRKKNPNWSIEKARNEFRKSNPEVKKREDAEAAQARKAA